MPFCPKKQGCERLNNGPIGVFDSGLGGLTAVKRMRELLPNENIIYLGDSGRAPYGSRSRDTIIGFTHDNISFLRQFGVKALVVACNTMCATALGAVRGEIAEPMLGVVEPTVRKAAAVTRNKRIGVIATVATIGSGIYKKSLRELLPDVSVFSMACPLLVPLVESGKIRRGDKETEKALREYLTPLMQEKIDTLILGCTHYPLLLPLIRDICGDGIKYVDSGKVTAEAVPQWLADMDLLSEGETEGITEYFVTGDKASFESTGSMFLREDIRGLVHRISLEDKE